MNLLNKINELYKLNIIFIFSKKSIYYTNLYLKSHDLQFPFHERYYIFGKRTKLFIYRYIQKKIFFLKK